MPEQVAKDYMGDGVYIEHLYPDGTVKLTTEDGICASNEIIIEPEVWRAMERYMKRVHESIKD